MEGRFQFLSNNNTARGGGIEGFSFSLSFFLREKEKAKKAAGKTKRFAWPCSKTTFLLWRTRTGLPIVSRYSWVVSEEEESTPKAYSKEMSLAHTQSTMQTMNEGPEDASMREEGGRSLTEYLDPSGKTMRIS